MQCRATDEVHEKGKRQRAKRNGGRKLTLILLWLILLTVALVTSAPAEREPKHDGATNDSLFVNSLGMEFVPVPGTKLLFCKWETRVQDFETFVKETGHDATKGMYSVRNGSWERRGDVWNSPGFAQGPTHPVCGVSWDDAKAFCKWLTKKDRAAGLLGPNQEHRLPNDWEWSVAVGLNEAREGTPCRKCGMIPNVYPWNKGKGTWPPPKGAGNYCPSLNVDTFDWTSPVGLFEKNAYGLYDMGGNIWEWCEDKYRPPEEYRVLRGGCWDPSNRGGSQLSSYRYFNRPYARSCNYGFRCVLAPRAVTPGWEAEPIEATRDHPFASETKRVPQHAPGSFRFELADGSTVTGKPSFPSIVVTLSFGDITMLIDQIVAVQFSEEDPTAQIELRNGDTVKGKVKLGAFTVDVKGKTIPVDGSQVRSIRCP